MNYRILIVEEDSAALAAMAEYLESLGLLVDAVPGLEQARGLLEDPSYAFLVSCLGFRAGMTAEGLTFLAQARGRRPDLPALVLTAWGGEDVHEQVRRLGIKTVLVKPQPLSRIAEVIRTELAGARASG